MPTTERTADSAVTLRREFGRPWGTLWRWAMKAGLWEFVGSGTALYFTPEEAAGLRTLNRCVDLLGAVAVTPDLAFQIVRERGPVLMFTDGYVISIEWEEVPDMLARYGVVTAVPVVPVSGELQEPA